MKFKGISEDVHVLADAAFIPITWAAPRLFKYTEDRKATNLTRGMSIATLGYTMLTDAKWGLIPLLSYKTHAAIDLTMGIATIAAPELLKIQNKNARACIRVMGITCIAVGTLSLFNAMNRKNA